jgi:hypothetical protein
MATLLERDLRIYRSNITVVSGGPVRPLYAEMGIPFYFSNNYRLPSPEPGEDTRCLATGDARWADVLKSKFSVAAYRAGFHRSPNIVSGFSADREMSVENIRVLPPPFMAILGVEPSYSSCALLGQSTPRNETELPLVAILNVDFSL